MVQGILLKEQKKKSKWLSTIETRKDIPKLRGWVSIESSLSLRISSISTDTNTMREKCFIHLCFYVPSSKSLMYRSPISTVLYVWKYVKWICKTRQNSYGLYMS